MSKFRDRVFGVIQDIYVVIDKGGLYWIDGPQVHIAYESEILAKGAARLLNTAFQAGFIASEEDGPEDSGQSLWVVRKTGTDLYEDADGSFGELRDAFFYRERPEFDGSDLCELNEGEECAEIKLVAE